MSNSQQQWWGDFAKTKKHDCTTLIEKAKTYNCSKDHKMQVVREYIQIPSMEPKLLHTIALHQHSNQMLDLIEDQELSLKKGSTLMLEPPLLPEEPDVNTNGSPQTPFEFLTRTSDDIITSKVSKPPPINAEIKAYVLKQCVATLLAHVGFETSLSTAFEVLRDALDDFLYRLCSLLRTCVDSSATGCSEGFPDEVERVMKEIGVGGIQSLHDYYMQGVINYQKVMKNKSEQLIVKHASLIPKLKYEMQMQEDEVPEIHLGTIEGDQSNLTSLESCFQMLDSLEQEVHLHIMEDQDNKMS